MYPFLFSIRGYRPSFDLFRGQIFSIHPHWLHARLYYQTLSFIKITMKTFQPFSFFRQIFHIAKITFLLIGFTGISACATVNAFFTQTSSSLPIETIESTAGTVSNTRAYEFSNRLYVAGYIQKSFGLHIPYGAHVDVQLIDKDGKVILEKQEKINPSHPKYSGKTFNHISYVVSFSPEEARHAAKIIVRYHLNGHRS